MDQATEPETVVMPVTMLTDLYAHDFVEFVHGIAGADKVIVQVFLGGSDTPMELTLPAGDYLIEHMTRLPTTRRGIFAVQEPREQPRGQPRGQQ